MGAKKKIVAARRNFVIGIGIIIFAAAIIVFLLNNTSSITGAFGAAGVMFEIQASTPSITFVAPTPSSSVWQTAATNTFNATVTGTADINGCAGSYDGEPFIFDVSMIGSGTSVICNVTKTFDEGIHTVQFRANYSDGNSSTKTTTVRIDTVAPTISYAASTQATGATIGRNSVTVETVGQDATSGVDYITIFFYNATALLNQTNSSPITFSNIPDGIYFFNATGYDLGGLRGNAATRNVTINATVPLYFVGPTDANNLRVSRNSIAVNLSVTSQSFSNATINLINTTAVVQSIFTRNATQFVNFTNLADGTYYINATANNTVGAINATETRVIVLDTRPPSVAIVAPPSSAYRISDFIMNATVTDGISGVNSSAIYYRFENSTFNSTWFAMANVSASNWNATVTVSAISDGNYTFRVNATDEVNNVNATSIAETIVVDKIQPAQVIINPNDHSGFNSNFTINITSSDLNGINSSRVFYRIENNTFNSSWLQMSSTAGFFSATLPITQFANGNYTFRFNVSDLPGNVNLTTIVNGIIIDTVEPACRVLINKEAITMGDALTSGDIECQSTDNIGIKSSAVAADTKTSGTKIATCLVTDVGNNTKSCTAPYDVRFKGSSGADAASESGIIGEETSALELGTLSVGMQKIISGLSELNIEQIKIESKEEIQNARVIISASAGKPEGILDEPAGKIYEYISVAVPGADSSINIEVVFRVRRIWAELNHIDKDAIEFVRFGDGSWESLPVHAISEGNDFIFYKAKSSSIATFAITGKQTIPQKPAAVPEKAETQKIIFVEPVAEQIEEKKEAVDAPMPHISAKAASTFGIKTNRFMLLIFVLVLFSFASLYVLKSAGSQPAVVSRRVDIEERKMEMLSRRILFKHQNLPRRIVWMQKGAIEAAQESPPQFDNNSALLRKARRPEIVSAARVWGCGTTHKKSKIEKDIKSIEMRLDRKTKPLFSRPTQSKQALSRKLDYVDSIFDGLKKRVKK